MSRAFSDPGKLSKDTLKRVLKAAEELNYKPNSMAQLFRIKRTNAVLVMVPDVANVLFARILSGIERIATEKDYFLLVSDTKDDPEVERAGLEMVETRRADGVIQLGERGLDPARTTMLAYGARMNYRSPRPEWYLEYWSDRVRRLLEASVRDRSMLPEGRTVDVLFHDARLTQPGGRGLPGPSAVVDGLLRGPGGMMFL